MMSLGSNTANLTNGGESPKHSPQVVRHVPPPWHVGLRLLSPRGSSTETAQAECGSTRTDGCGPTDRGRKG